MTDRARPRVLLYGRGTGALVPVPALFSRAGFEVTLITAREGLRALQHVDHFIKVNVASQIAERAREELAAGYDLVLAGDDLSLRDVRDADMPMAQKLQLLPITSERGLKHIASKIGLSEAFLIGGVTTPDFRMATERSDLAAAVAQLGYPVMVKTDFGVGSNGVLRLKGPADLASLPDDFGFPVLVQRAIDGLNVDTSGFFRNGELVSFSKSVVLTTTKPGGLGGSRTRRYYTHPERDEALVKEMRGIGRALDANGFVSLGAIRSDADGRMYVYEADMRPMVWIEYPKHFGEDPAVDIAGAFGLPPPASTTTRRDWPESVVLAHGPRLTTLDVLLNRYNWRGNFDDYLGRGVLRHRFGKWLDGPNGRNRKQREQLRKQMQKRMKQLRNFARRVKTAICRRLPGGSR